MSTRNVKQASACKAAEATRDRMLGNAPDQRILVTSTFTPIIPHVPRQSIGEASKINMMGNMLSTKQVDNIITVAM